MQAIAQSRFAQALPKRLESSLPNEGNTLGVLQVANATCG